MNWKRQFALGASALVIGLIYGQAASADEVDWWVPNWEEPRVDDLIKKFEAANPGTTVKVEVTTSDGLQNRVLVALQSGAPPDLIDIQNGWNIPFANTGTLLALDDVVKQQNINLGDFLDSGMSTAKLDGQLYGLPFRIEAHAIIYNKGAFKAAGLDPDKPPQTWTELIADAKALTGKGANGQDQYGFAITGGGEFGNTIYRLLPFMWMNGGGIITDDMKSVIVNSPESVAAVKFYTDMFTTLKVAPPSTLQNDGTAARRLFIAGTAAMYQSGQYDLASIHKENPNLQIGTGIIPHPDGKQTTALLGGWNWVIPKDAKNKDGAAKLLAFMAQPENMGVYTDTFPATKAAMALPRFQDPELKAFADMLPYARPPQPQANWIQITQAFFNHVQAVLAGQATPQDAMDAASQEIQPLLSQ